jgi:hypothetical protein
MSACGSRGTLTTFAMTSPTCGSEETHQTQEARFVVDAIPTLAWSALSYGLADFFNQRWLDYTGLSAEQAHDWGWTVALHSDDVNALVLWAIASGYSRTLAGSVPIGLVVPWRMPPMPAAALEKPCK